MDTSWFLGLTGFAFAMAATPGPNNIMVMASGAAFGLARTLPLMAGIGFGVAAMMLIVAGFGPATVANPRVGAALKWIGTAYLLWLAWKIAQANPHPAVRNASDPVPDVPLSFLDGAVFQCVNPKLWVMASGAVVTYGQASDFDQTMLSALFAAVFGGITFLSTIAWTALGASAGRFLTSASAIRRFNLAMAALLVASLVPVIFD